MHFEPQADPRVLASPLVQSTLVSVIFCIVIDWLGQHTWLWAVTIGQVLILSAEGHPRKHQVLQPELVSSKRRIKLRCKLPSSVLCPPDFQCQTAFSHTSYITCGIHAL